MIRVGFVCGDYPPGPHGGIGTTTQLLARALVRRGGAARVIGVYSPDYPAEDLADDCGVRVTRLRERQQPLGWVVARARLARTVAGWARRGEVDVIEVPDWQGWAAGWPRLPVPVVARLNGSASYFAAERGESADRMTRWLESQSLRRADFVCSASRYTADRTWQLFALPAPEPTVLYNPVEPGTRPTGVRRGYRVIFSGTLTQKKGVVSLIKAWPEVVARVPTAELHLFGKDGGAPEGLSMESHLRALLPERSLPTVRFHGHVDRGDLLVALSTARAAVFPSYAEAFALAPLEAMACGCPTIYSKRGSGPELIRDGADGLLIDPDRPEEIAGAIVRVLCDEQLAQTLAVAGRRRVAETFSLEELAERNEDFYSQCVGAFGRPRAR